MTPTVIEVITSNEVVHANADAELGVTLTPLSATLEKLLSLADQGGPPVTELRRSPDDEPRLEGAGPAGLSRDHGRLFRVPVLPPERSRRPSGAPAHGLHDTGVRQRAVAALAAADDGVLLFLLADRYARRHSSAHLVHQAHPVSRHPPDSGQRLHHLALQRADRQGRDGVLPQQTRPGAGVGSLVRDAVHHVLRGLLSADLGDRGIHRQQRLAAPGLRSHAVHLRGSRCGARSVDPLFPRSHPSRQPASRQEDLPRVQDGHLQALRAVLPAALACPAVGRAWCTPSR